MLPNATRKSTPGATANRRAKECNSQNLPGGLGPGKKERTYSKKPPNAAARESVVTTQPETTDEGGSPPASLGQEGREETHNKESGTQPNNKQGRDQAHTNRRGENPHSSVSLQEMVMHMMKPPTNWTIVGRRFGSCLLIGTSNMYNSRFMSLTSVPVPTASKYAMSCLMTASKKFLHKRMLIVLLA